MWTLHSVISDTAMCAKKIISEYNGIKPDTVGVKYNVPVSGIAIVTQDGDQDYSIITYATDRTFSKMSIIVHRPLLPGAILIILSGLLWSTAFRDGMAAGTKVSSGIFTVKTIIVIFVVAIIYFVLLHLV